MLALLARILVPAGFMPGAGTHGAPALVICSGQGPLTISPAMAMAMPGMTAMPGMSAMPMHHGDGGGGEEGTGHAGDHPCPFAGFAALTDFARFVPPALPFLPAEALARSILHFARPGLGLAAPPPPKTGPPTFR